MVGTAQMRTTKGWQAWTQTRASVHAGGYEWGRQAWTTAGTAWMRTTNEDQQGSASTNMNEGKWAHRWVWMREAPTWTRASEHAGRYKWGMHKWTLVGTYKQERVLHKQGWVSSSLIGGSHPLLVQPIQYLVKCAPHQLTCAGCFHKVAMRLEEDKPAGIEHTTWPNGYSYCGYRYRYEYRISDPQVTCAKP